MRSCVGLFGPRPCRLLDNLDSDPTSFLCSKSIVHPEPLESDLANVALLRRSPNSTPKPLHFPLPLFSFEEAVMYICCSNPLEHQRRHLPLADQPDFQSQSQLPGSMPYTIPKGVLSAFLRLVCNAFGAGSPRRDMEIDSRPVRLSTSMLKVYMSLRVWR